MATKKNNKASKSSSKSAKAASKFHFVNSLHNDILSIAEVTRKGEVRIKRAALKSTLENAFNQAMIAAAKGERVKFPVIGSLGRKEVPARTSKQGTNPFTGEPMMIKARKESKKPRWSFPKTIKETFANKRYW